MQMTFRWFGKELDTVSLKQIKQIPNVVGVVPALHDLPAGEAWTLDRVQKMYDEITAAGLSMECIESVNVHEDIKIGLPTRDKLIENYKTSIRNLAKVGVKCICYNFMPVFDWTRTDLYMPLLTAQPAFVMMVSRLRANLLRICSVKLMTTQTAMQCPAGKAKEWARLKSFLKNTRM